MNAWTDRLHAGLVQDLRQRDRVLLMRVHAAGRHQAEQVAGAARRLQLRDQVRERRRAGEAAVLGGLADVRQLLHHHAPGADVQVADLGVAHLAVRQPDVAAGGVQEGVRAALPQPVEVRLARLTDRVVGGFLAPAEAVEDHQHHRPNRLRHGSAPIASRAMGSARRDVRTRAARAMPFTIMSFASCPGPSQVRSGHPRRGAKPWRSRPSPTAIMPITPYLVVDGAARLIDFLAGGVRRRGGGAACRTRRPHRPCRDADRRFVVMLGDAHGEHKPLQTMLYVYVDDADAAYQRALAAGAASVQAPADQFYGDRSGGVRDPFGNLWWIATHIEDVPPDGTEAARAGSDGAGRRQLTASALSGTDVCSAQPILRWTLRERRGWVERKRNPSVAPACSVRGDRVQARLRHHAVLRCDSTAGADRADQLAVDHDRKASLGRHPMDQREQTERGRRATVDRVGQ